MREFAAATDAGDAATAAGDAATAADCNHRLLWIRDKQRFLDTRNEMVWDMPVWQNGRQMEFGSLEPAARRPLTYEEIRWNAEMIEAERLPHHARRGSASPASVSKRQRPVVLRPATTKSKCARPVTRPQTSP